MMKRVLLIGIAMAFIWTGCIQDEAALIPDQQEAQRLQPKDSVWVVSIRAEKAIPGAAGNEGMTKGLAIGAGVSEDSTTVLQSIWKADEPVEVYLKGAHIGTLKATPDPTDFHQATLSGTVTTTGITAGTTLTLLTPRQDWDYTGQVGRLLMQDDLNYKGEDNRSIEMKYHYTMAENVLVTAASNGTITTDQASFANQQSIYRLSFRFQHNGAGTPYAINARRIWITAADGGLGLVQTRALDGSSVTGTIEVLLDYASQNPFFVVLRNNNTTTAEDLRFKVMDNEGITYFGTKNIPAAYKPNGTFVSMKNATLTGRLELAVGNESVTEVL